MATFQITNFVNGNVRDDGTPESSTRNRRGKIDAGVPISISIPANIGFKLWWYSTTTSYSSSTLLQSSPEYIISDNYTLPVVEGAVAVLITTDYGDLSILNSQSTYEIGEASSKTISLSVNKSSIRVNEELTYTATLSESLASDLVCDISGVNSGRTLTITAGQTTGSFTYSPTTTGTVTASISGTNNPDVTVTGSSAITQVTAAPTGTITSTQSGNWEDGTTWVGGIAPTVDNDVIIETGHIVTYNIKTTYASRLTLRGTLNIATDIEFMFGERDGVSADLYFDGGTLGGQGTVRVNKGSCITNPDKWSYCKDSVTLGASAASYQDPVTWDLRKLSFSSTGQLVPQFKIASFGESTNTFRMENCVVQGAEKVVFGVSGSLSPTDMTIQSCDFIETAIEVLGSGIQTGNKQATFDRCVLRGTSFRATMAGVLPIIRNSFFNGAISSANQGILFENSLHMVKLGTEGGTTFGTITASNSTVRNSVMYYPDSEFGNLRYGTVANVENTYHENWTLNDGNGWIVRNPQAVSLTGNIFVGHGSHVLNSQDTGVTSITMRNNTTFAMGNASGALIAFESYKPNSSSTIDLYNNLSMAQVDNPNFVYAIKYGEPPYSELITVDMDYNAKYQITDWYTRPELFNNVSGTHNIDNANPNFIDNTRTVKTWALANIGSDSYESILSHFEAMNGYDSITATQSKPIIQESIADIHAWLYEGYTPTNGALSTSGEGGTFIGAIEPSEGPTPPEPPKPPVVPHLSFALFAYGLDSRSYDSYFSRNLEIQNNAVTDAFRIGSHAGALILNVSAYDDVFIPKNGLFEVEILEANSLEDEFIEGENSLVVKLKQVELDRTFTKGQTILRLALNDSKAYQKAKLLVSGALTGSVDIYLTYAPR